MKVIRKFVKKGFVTVWPIIIAICVIAVSIAVVKVLRHLGYI
jgi:DNA-binding transcriptional regulator of glucitol operon